MKKLVHYEVMEFTFETEEEREKHVEELALEGWEDIGSRKKLKDGVSILNATKEDHEWYAALKLFK
ncbi:hypothetical protein [Bacillus subtilis]|uniref:hypothetical protein n=1 Tax=Bacillus subtilis TaxID=1423 RepID=UPI001C225390|nr:hypothetical protein [Bacillus subtilis]MBU8716594.1 hypothetical protein [Bacillus subtilis]